MKNYIATLQGRNGVGGCTAQGLKSGDKVISVVELINVGIVATISFGSYIPVDNTIYQSSGGDLSANSYLALVERSE